MSARTLNLRKSETELEAKAKSLIEKEMELKKTDLKTLLARNVSQQQDNMEKVQNWLDDVHTCTALTKFSNVRLISR